NRTTDAIIAKAEFGFEFNNLLFPNVDFNGAKDPQAIMAREDEALGAIDKKLAAPLIKANTGGVVIVGANNMRGMVEEIRGQGNAIVMPINPLKPVKEYDKKL